MAKVYLEIIVAQESSNQNIPAFVDDYLVISFNESYRVPRLLADMNAKMEDKEMDEDITYELVGGFHDEKFSINRNNVSNTTRIDEFSQFQVLHKFLFLFRIVFLLTEQMVSGELIWCTPLVGIGIGVGNGISVPALSYHCNRSLEISWVYIKLVVYTLHENIAFEFDSC